MAEIDWNVSEMRKSLPLYSHESSFQRFGLLADEAPGVKVPVPLVIVREEWIRLKGRFPLDLTRNSCLIRV